MTSSHDYISSVTLIILGDDLDPHVVSDALGMEPSRCWRRGEEKKLAPGTFYDWGGWKCFGPDTDAEVEDKIDYWLVQLRGKESELKSLKRRGCRCLLDVFLAFDEVATLQLTSEFHRKIADLGLDLDICINSGDANSEQGAGGNE